MDQCNDMRLSYNEMIVTAVFVTGCNHLKQTNRTINTRNTMTGIQPNNMALIHVDVVIGGSSTRPALLPPANKRASSAIIAVVAGYR